MSSIVDAKQNPQRRAEIREECAAGGVDVLQHLARGRSTFGSANADACMEDSPLLSSSGSPQWREGTCSSTRSIAFRGQFGDVLRVTDNRIK